MRYKNSTFSLLDAPADCRVRVRAISGDGPSRSRLCALGFTPGTDVTVFEGCPCRTSRKVCIRGSSLVLGDVLAKCVLCDCPAEEACPQQSDCCCEEALARRLQFGRDKC